MRQDNRRLCEVYSLAHSNTLKIYVNKVEEGHSFSEDILCDEGEVHSRLCKNLHQNKLVPAGVKHNQNKINYSYHFTFGEISSS